MSRRAGQVRRAGRPYPLVAPVPRRTRIARSHLRQCGRRSPIEIRSPVRQDFAIHGTDSVSTVLTVGIDLAAEAARSAMAVIRWDKTVAVIEQLALGATDRVLVEAARPADKVGIDCPLGWPVRSSTLSSVTHAVTYGRARARHRSSTPACVPTHGSRGCARWWSDSVVRLQRPDRASRDAGCWAAVRRDAGRDHGPLRPRAGGRGVPGSGTRWWGYESRRYKGAPNAGTRRILVDRVLDATSSWLAISTEHRAACARSDDVFDAVVAALNARAATLPGAVSVPGPHELSEAIIEGWIAVPVGGLPILIHA